MWPTRPAPPGASACKTLRRRRSCPPRLERLEDRLAPATLIVNSTADSSAAGAALTLREAILLVNNAGEVHAALGRDLTPGEAAQITGIFGNNDTIEFGGGLDGQTITLGGSALPTITQNVTINGPGPGELAVSGAGQSRVLAVGPGADATINGILIEDGVAAVVQSGNSTTQEGGGILNQGTLALDNCVLISNAAVLGGAIYSGYDQANGTVTSCTLEIAECKFAGNNGKLGGGVNATGQLTIDASTFSGNAADAGHGGGVYQNSGTLQISYSTFANNTSSQGGGAITNETGSTLDLSDSTLMGNSVAAGIGGGIENEGMMDVTDSTLSGNTAASGGAVANDSLSSLAYNTLDNVTLAGNTCTSSGGGIWTATQVQKNQDLSLTNTLVAENMNGYGPSATEDDISGPVSSGSGNNLLGAAGGSGLVNGINGNLVNVSTPGLAPLGNYGGPTQTIALLPGSPAIDAGFPSTSPGTGTDQRGQPRVVGSAVDIGAFESQGFTLTPTGGNNQTAAVGQPFGSPLSVQVTANNSVEPVNGGVVTFTVPALGASAVPSSATAAISGGAAAVTATANSTAGSYTVAASSAGSAPVGFNLTNTTTVQPDAYVVGNTSASGAGSLEAAVAAADADASGKPITITFAAAAGQPFATAQTITLAAPMGSSQAALDLSNTTAGASITIQGPAAGVTISGGGKYTVLRVEPGVTAFLSGLTIANGNASVPDPAAYGNPEYDGGGIYNEGNLVLSDSTLTSNTATYDGGGLYSVGLGSGAGLAHVALADDTFSNNQAASGIGGGIDNWLSSPMTLTGVTLYQNTDGGGSGGGVADASNLTINNSTFFMNTVKDYGDFGGGEGGGLWAGTGASVVVTNSTFSGNQALPDPAGHNGEGGGLFSFGSLTLENTIVAGNTAGTGPDIDGTLSNAAYDLVGNGAGTTSLSGFTNMVGYATHPLNPLLAPLGNYGGPTPTLPLLPGSPAIDAGSTVVVPAGDTTDQRGLPRVAGSAVDVGAFESQGFTLTPTGGNNQTAAVGQPFGSPLSVRVTANNSAEPVNGGVVTFTVPALGASAVPSSATAAISGGAAAVTATANSTAGSYTVAASSAGSAPVGFNLTNTTTVQPDAYVVGNTSASGAGSLEAAVAAADADDSGKPVTITFAAGAGQPFATAQTITLTAPMGSSQAALDLSNTTAGASITIQGPAAGVTISGGGKYTVLQIDSGVTAFLSGLTIADGNASVPDPEAAGYPEYDGGGIYNEGNLVLSDSTLTLNTASYAGGGLYSYGMNGEAHVTLIDDTLSFNVAVSPASSTWGGRGGGIDNDSDSTMTLTGVTVYQNIAKFGPQASSIFSGPDGGGIFNEATLTASDCTISQNEVLEGGGGGISADAPVSLQNTIVAGNTAATGPDIDGTVNSAQYDLIGNGSGATGLSGPGNQVGTAGSPINPLLGPLGNYGGLTQTLALLPGSPAIDAGSTALVPAGTTTDQRGQPRVVGSAVDVGAFESQGFTLTPLVGGGQTATVGRPFAEALGVQVAANHSGDAVDGGVVTFTVPTTGSSAALSSVTVTVSGGVAYAAATANNTAGSYTVSAAANGAGQPVGFNLKNTTAAQADVYTVVNTNGSGPGSLSYAIAQADSDTSGQAITVNFAAAAGQPFAAAQTITPSAPLNPYSALLDLTNTTTDATITLQGPTSDLTISGNDAYTVFQIQPGVTALLNGLTIANGDGSVPDPGSELGNSTYDGGGIFNEGHLTLTDSTIIACTADFAGGGLFSYASTPQAPAGVTLTNDTFSYDQAFNPNSSVDVTAQGGGGVLNSQYSVLTANGVTFVNNSVQPTNVPPYAEPAEGGAILNDAFAQATVSNSTFANNEAVGYGGAVADYGTLTLTDSTLYDNQAATNSSGEFGGGGGLYDSTNGQATLTVLNSIVAGNTAATDPDIDGPVNSAQYDLIGNGSGATGLSGSGNQVGTATSPINPLLAPLGSYGGPTQTLALLPGSPAIAGGSTTLIPTGVTTDQRGEPLVVGGAVDIGAFESQGFTLTATGGNQTATVGQPFAAPLAVRVMANNSVEPVNGGVVTFTAPASGPSAALSATTATITGGVASVTATANSTPGSYTVAAAASDARPASFALTNAAASPPDITGVTPTSGPVASNVPVTITGTNFVGATAVDFGSVMATSFVLDSATQITAVAPPEGAGTVVVTVTTAAGTSGASSAAQFSYVAGPTVTGVSPPSGPTAGGTTVTINGSSFLGATAVSFGKTAAVSFSVNAAGTQISAVDPAEAAGTVDVTVTTAGGTSATSSADQFSYLAGPTVTGVSPSSGPTAGGTTVTVSGSGFAGATAVSFGKAAAVSFSVNAAGTQISAVDPAGAAGTVDVTVTTAGGTSATSSADQFSYLAGPTVTGVSPSSGPTAGGTAVTISGSGFTGATAVSFGKAAVSFSVNAAGTQISAVDPAEAAGTVDVTVTTAGGTSATSSADQFSYLAGPTVTGVSPSSGPTTGGTAVTISGSSFAGATAVRFGGVAAASFSVNAAGTQISAVEPAGAAGTVDVTVTTPGGTSPTGSTDHFRYVATPTGVLVVNLPGQGVQEFTPAGVFSQLSSSDASVLATNSQGDITAEFPGVGVDRYEPATGWVNLTPATPSLLALDGAGNVFGEFTSGVWRYTTATGWQQLTGSNASQLAVNAAGDVVGVFSVGVYGFLPASGWAPLSTAGSFVLSGLTPSVVAIDGAGDVTGEFPGAGVWRYTTAFGWTTLPLPAALSGKNASTLAGDTAGDVVAEFPGAGVWYYTASSISWAQVSTTDVARLSIDATGNVLASSVAGTTYLPVGGSTWQTLSATAATLVAESGGGGSDAAGDVLAEVPGGGVSRYEPATGFVSLNGGGDASLLASNANGDAVALVGSNVMRYSDATATWTTLALPATLSGKTAALLAIDGVGSVTADFQGGAGLWRYTDASGAWTPLSVPAALAGTDATLLAVNASGDIAADFGGNGVWRYEASTGWQQLTATEASLLGIDLGGDVAAEFPGYGIYMDNGGGFAQLTATSATQLSVDPNGVVAAEFPGLGLWRHQPASGWQQLSATDAALVSTDAADDVLATFPGTGLTRYSLTGTAGTSVAATSAALLATAGGVSHLNDYLAEARTGAGVWRYEEPTGWAQLTIPPTLAIAGMTPTLVAVNENGDVAAVFPGEGVWRYRDATGWAPLTLPANLAGVNATQLGIDAAGDVFALLPGGASDAGLLEHTDAGWHQLTPLAPSALAVNANGQVVGAFFGLGVYLHNSTGWTQLTGSQATLLSMGGAGDVVGQFGSLGVYRYTDANGWQSLSLPQALAGATLSQLAVNAAGAVAGVFAGQGVYLYTSSTGWQVLPLPSPATGVEPTLLAFDGLGDLVAEVPGHGLYRYRNGAWSNVGSTTADASALGA
jgi:hypothetical protein